MKAVLIGIGIKEHVSYIISNLKAMSISDPIILVERPVLPKDAGVIRIHNMDSMLVYEVPKSMDFDSKISAVKIHDDLYALRPGLDPVDMPLIREKKKKLPRHIRKFAGYN